MGAPGQTLRHLTVFVQQTRGTRGRCAIFVLRRDGERAMAGVRGKIKSLLELEEAPFGKFGRGAWICPLTHNRGVAGQSLPTSGTLLAPVLVVDEGNPTLPSLLNRRPGHST